MPAGLNVNPEVLKALPAKERDLVLRDLAAVERALKENPLLALQYHQKQIEFAEPPFPATRLFLGGNRSGKTTTGMTYGNIQCLPPEFVPEHLRRFKRWGWDGPCFGRVITPDLTSTMEGVVLQKVRDWCPPGALKGNSVDRAFDKVQRVLKFKNGSWIQFMSNDQDLDKFGGTALHWVLFDEEPRQDVYSENLMRLIDYGGERLFTMTPLSGMSWVYDEFFEPWERDELEDARIVVVDMDDNPHLSEEGKRIALSGLSGEELEARKSGRFVSFQGLIYPSFSTSTHVIPDYVPGEPPERGGLPEGVEFFEGIDPGIRHMAAVLFCFLDFDDKLVVYDELAIQGQTVADVCKRIKLKREQWQVRPSFTVIDPAARNKSSQTGRSDQQEYLDHGIPTIPGQNEVRAGINRVRERLEANRLLICARCQELRGEFKKYRWAKNSTRTENAPREQPAKVDDHLLDVIRYIAMQRPLVPRRELIPETLTLKDRMLRKSLEALSRGSQGRRMPDTGFGPGQWL